MQVRSCRAPEFSLFPFPFSLLLLLTLACSGSGSGTRFLSIATGGTGGVYYPYGGGIAKIINENVPGVRATAEVTAASVDNLKLIRDGKADLAFTFADTLADAVQGRGAFQPSGPVPVASLAVLYANFLHLVALGSSNIHTVEDLRGKVISTGSPGSGTEVLAFRVLRAAGLDPARDVRHQGLGVSESVEALKDGKVEAFFWGGGLPTPAVQDLTHTSGITVRLIPTAHLVPSLRKEFGAVYFETSVDAGVYKGVTAPVAVIGSFNVLVVNKAMDDQLAYDITRVLFEKQSELAAIHPEARKLSLDTAAADSPADFHPGAVRLLPRERRVEEIDQDFERGATRHLTGLSQRLASVLAAALSAYALYWVLAIVQPQIYRVSFLLIALVLTFLLFPATRRSRQARVPAADWILVAATVVALGWPLADFGRFVYRAAEPLPIDLILGTVTIVLVLEAARRAIGWVLPVTAVAFLVYAWAGPAFDRIGLSLIAHRGYGFDRLVGTLYMSLEGMFGVPLDVTATYIILFTIYGAVLEQCGAGRFFIAWALSASGKSVAAPARAVGDHRRVSAGHGLGQRGSHHRDARFGRLAGASTRRLCRRDRGGHAVGRGHRRAPVATDAGSRRLPHRGVPADLVSAGPGHGDHPDHPVLPGDFSDDRGRRPKGTSLSPGTVTLP